MNIQEVKQIIKPLVGEKCCAAFIGKDGGLRLGFGKKIFHGNDRLITKFNGEWELGTYYGSWRIIKSAKILYGNKDVCDDPITKSNALLERISFGCFTSAKHLTDMDIRVELDNNIMIDFLATSNDEDELFHIFCPQQEYIEFSIARSWRMGKSNRPWRK